MQLNLPLSLNTLVPYLCNVHPGVDGLMKFQQQSGLLLHSNHHGDHVHHDVCRFFVGAYSLERYNRNQNENVNSSQNRRCHQSNFENLSNGNMEAKVVLYSIYTYFANGMLE